MASFLRIFKRNSNKSYKLGNFYTLGCIVKIKMIKAALAGLVLAVSGIANAGLITEKWSGTINFSNVPTLAVGSTLEWTVIYDNTATYSDSYYDGVDDTSFTDDDILYSRSDNVLFKGAVSTFQSNAIYEFGNVFDVMELFILQQSGYLTPNNTNTRWTIGDGVSQDYLYSGNNHEFTMGINPYNYTYTPAIIDPDYARFNIFYQETLPTGIVNPRQAFLELSNLTLHTVASVPGPSTLAIFALGLMGLASRRFKKQS